MFFLFPCSAWERRHKTPLLPPQMRQANVIKKAKVMCRIWGGVRRVPEGGRTEGAVCPITLRTQERPLSMTTRSVVTRKVGKAPNLWEDGFESVSEEEFYAEANQILLDPCNSICVFALRRVPVHAGKRSGAG